MRKRTPAVLLAAALAAAPARAQGPAPAPPGFEHRYATVDGVRMHYVTGGHGDPVLLLHGWPVTSYAWRHVMPRLAGRYTVLAVDLPGLGDSPPPAGYTAGDAGRAVMGLLRQLGYARVHVVAHDLGGFPGYWLAASHPEMVSTLTFVESGLPGFGLERGMDVANGGSWHWGFNMNAELSQVLVAGRERPFLEYFYRRGMVNPGTVTAADLDEYVRSYAGPGHMRAGFEYYRAYPETARELRPLYAQRLAMPVMAVGAGRGIGRSAATAMQGVAASVRDEMVAQCGHHMPDDCPEPLAQLLLDFLSTAPRTGGR